MGTRDRRKQQLGAIRERLATSISRPKSGDESSRSRTPPPSGIPEDKSATKSVKKRVVISPGGSVGFEDREALDKEDPKLIEAFSSRIQVSRYGQNQLGIRRGRTQSTSSTWSASTSRTSTQYVKHVEYVEYIEYVQDDVECVEYVEYVQYIQYDEYM